MEKTPVFIENFEKQSFFSVEALMLQLAHEAFIIRDLDGRISFWSRGAENIYGWTQREALEQITHELLKTKFPRPMEEILAELAAHNYWDGELIHTRKDNQTITVASRWALQRNSENQTVGVLEINRDITKLKNTEASLQKQIAMLNLSAHDAIIVRETGDRIKFWNRAAEKIYGWTEQEALGQVTHHLLKTQFPKPIREIGEEMETTGLWQGELIHTRKDGQILTIASKWSSRRFPLVQGEVLEINRDITQQRNIEKQRDHALKTREELIGVVSHEIRTPLTAIGSGLQVLRRLIQSDKDDKKKIQQMLSNMFVATHRMSSITADLLEVSTIESGNLKIESSSVEIPSLVEEVIALSRFAAEEKSLAIVKKISPEVKTIICDRDRIIQVLSNFLSNAIKFTEPGGTIEIILDRSEAETCFKIRDTGCGIPANDLPHVFERFWQANNKPHAGSGLGLYISKGFVEAHGGHCEVQSTVGQGSTFYFSLPTPPSISKISDKKVA